MAFAMANVMGHSRVPVMVAAVFASRSMASLSGVFVTGHADEDSGAFSFVQSLANMLCVICAALDSL